MKCMETDLRIIQKADTRNKIITTEDLDVPKQRLDVLKAMGLIEIHPLYDNFLRVVISDEGLTYFIRKEETSKTEKKNNRHDILVAVVAAIVGSGITLLIQELLK